MWPALVIQSRDFLERSVKHLNPQWNFNLRERRRREDVIAIFLELSVGFKDMHKCGRNSISLLGIKGSLAEVIPYKIVEGLKLIVYLENGP